jgi:hypothetical protein
MRRSLKDRILLWMSSGKDIDGLWVGTETEAERVLPRVESALVLIKKHDRQRYDRIVADLDRIWVRLLTTSVAQFSPPWQACLLDERFVLGDSTDTAHIAAAIVHEATHARLWRYGFGYDEDVRQRVEEVCVRREVAFANKLPEGEPIRAWAADALALPPSYWTNVAAQERHHEGSLQALHYLTTGSHVRCWPSSNGGRHVCLGRPGKGKAHNLASFEPGRATHRLLGLPILAKADRRQQP